MQSFLPSYQTLGFSSGWKLQRRSSLPYPLSYPRTRLYYLGRNAIYHGAKALGLGRGDGVLFPSYHSGTESAPMMHLGCDLQYYSVRPDLEIDLGEIESKIEPHTRAIYAIHFFGFPAPIQALRELADRRGLVLIEDVALSFLSEIDGRSLGTWGDISIFCLYKSLPLPAGGVLAVNRPDVVVPPETERAHFYSELNLTAKHVLNHLDLRGGAIGRSLRHGLRSAFRAVVPRERLRLESPDALDFDPEMLDRGMGLITRTLLRWINYRRVAERRRANYTWLVQRLHGSGVPLVRPALAEGVVPLFLPILAEDKFGTVEALHRQQIDAIPVWGIHHPYLPRGEFLGTEYLVDHAIEIPIHQTLQVGDLERIAQALIALRLRVRAAPEECLATA